MHDAMLRISAFMPAVVLTAAPMSSLPLDGSASAMKRASNLTRWVKSGDLWCSRPPPLYLTLRKLPSPEPAGRMGVWAGT
jgi:hypothetical protein